MAFASPHRVKPFQQIMGAGCLGRNRNLSSCDNNSYQVIKGNTPRMSHHPEDKNLRYILQARPADRVRGRDPWKQLFQPYLLEQKVFSSSTIQFFSKDKRKDNFVRAGNKIIQLVQGGQS